MDMFDEESRQIDLEYVQSALQRLEGMRQSIDLLSSSPNNTVELSKLSKNFHSLSVAASTFGFPKISRLGEKGERLCQECEIKRTISAGHLKTLRQFADSIRNTFLSSLQTEAPNLPPSFPSDSKIEMLVVHDDEEILNSFHSLAEKEGWIVHTASNHQQALLRIAEHKPVVMIVDPVRSEGSGYQLIEQVRSLPGASDLTVFAIAEAGQLRDRVEAVRSGVDAYFEKPVDWKLLTRKLREMVIVNETETPRILCVEDDLLMCDFLKTVLKSAGYKIRICVDPKDFGASFASFRPHLILIDMFLPGISGIELAKAVRQQEKYANLPILFLTTQTQMAGRTGVRKGRGDDYLIKPIAPPILLSIVAARLQRSKALTSLIDRDGLTGALTHSAFLKKAKIALETAREKQFTSALIMMDIDNFKDINHRYGHKMGDRILSDLSSLCRRRLRKSDILGRYQEDELAAVIEDLTEEDALRLIQRLRQEFAGIKHFAHDQTPILSTFSAGIAALRPEISSLQEWIPRAEQALNESKAAGKDRVTLYKPMLP